MNLKNIHHILSYAGKSRNSSLWPFSRQIDDGLGRASQRGIPAGMHRRADRGAKTVAVQLGEVYGFDGSVRQRKTPAEAGVGDVLSRKGKCRFPWLWSEPSQRSAHCLRQCLPVLEM